MTKILFGDDDEEFRKSYKRNFLRNFEVEEVSNLKGLVERARNSQYDLIITDNNYDYNIKELGLEAIRRIREFDSKIPILLQTGDLTDEVKNNALESGANYVINKRDYNGLKKILESYKEK